MTSLQEHLFTSPPHPYWIASTTATDYPALTENADVDVAIIGGGIAGITCAYLLKSTGQRVAVAEADSILQGATGHTTAKVTSQHQLIYTKIAQALGYDCARQYAEANEAAIAHIAQIVTKHHISCDFSRQKAYIYTQREGYVRELEQEAQLANKLGIHAYVIQKTDLPVQIKAALCFEEQAQFHPLKYLLVLAKEIPGNGSHIFEQTRIVQLEENGAYRLQAANGRYITAQRVVIATQYPCYNKAGLYFSRIYTDRSYAIAIKASESYPGGMYITAEEPARSFRATPAEDGELIIVSGEHHKTGQGQDTREHYRALVETARQVFAVQDIPYHWSTQDCMTVDGIPYVGHFLPSTPNMFLITGFGKWGMTNSMAAAMLIRDLIMHGESPWQEVYNPSRHSIKAAAKTFVVENLNVAKEFLSGKILPANDRIRLTAGESAIISYQGGKAGAYCDQQGEIHIVDLTCTHMGCELVWNAAERSWDCPCHGSRFTYTGDIITGPAITPLPILKKEQVDILL